MPTVWGAFSLLAALTQAPSPQAQGLPQGQIEPASFEAKTLPVLPQEARGLSEGRASLDCRVTDDLSLEDCRIASEAPEGRGVGGWAIAVAQRARARPQALDGSLLAGRRAAFIIGFSEETVSP